MELLTYIWQSMTATTKFQLATVWIGAIIAGYVAVRLKIIRSRLRASDIHGSAAFATMRQIRKMGLLSREGIVLGLLPGGKYATYNGPGHVSVIAKTRGGKGVGLIIPTLLSLQESVLVTDMKGENWKATAGCRAQYGPCYRFAPTQSYSHAFNPLDCVRQGDKRVGDAQMIASILCGMDADKLEVAHWQDTAWALLTTLMLYVVEHHNNKSLSGMLAVLNDTRRPIRKVLERLLQSPHHAIQLGARNLLNKHDNELSSIVSTASRHLMLYLDPFVAANTSRSDFRIEDFMQADKPISVYLVLPPADLERTANLFRLMICLITKRLTEELDAPENRTKLRIIYDEFSGFGRIEYFEKALSYIAGYGIRAVLIAQGVNQVRAVYGQATSVLDQCECRVFFGISDIVTAREVSAMLGNRTVKEWRKSYHKSRLGTANYSEMSTGRALLLPEEVIALPDSEVILKIGHHSPVQLKKILYYKDGYFAPLANQETPSVPFALSPDAAAEEIAVREVTL